ELERERQATAGLIGAAVGAALPNVVAGADVRAPGAAGSARAEVRPGAVAGAAALEALPQAGPPPGGTGAQVRRGQVEIGPTGGGKCMFAVWSERPEQDTSGVRVDLTLTQIIDIEARERQARLALDAQQVQLARQQRVTVMISLQRAGAD